MSVQVVGDALGLKPSVLWRVNNRAVGMLSTSEVYWVISSPSRNSHYRRRQRAHHKAANDDPQQGMSWDGGNVGVHTPSSQLTHVACVGHYIRGESCLAFHTFFCLRECPVHSKSDGGLRCCPFAVRWLYIVKFFFPAHGRKALTQPHRMQILGMIFPSALAFEQRSGAMEWSELLKGERESG
jgi:hypothetical protein